MSSSPKMYGNFRTDRLAVEPWDDAMADPTSKGSLLEELGTILDSDVTAFLPPSLVFQSGETKAEDWAKAFGSKGSTAATIRLTTADQQQPPLAGLLMLRPDKESSENDEKLHMHIGYIFGKGFWGKGLATELLRGIVSHLQQSKFKGTLLGGVDPGNPASSRVLEKAGFRKAPEGDGDNSDGVDWFQLSFDG